MGKPPSSRIHRGNPQFARPTLKGSLGSVSMSPDENSGTEPLNYRVLNATGDDDFIDQMYALANRITPGLLVIGTGPVSPALARDAQDALRDLGATLLWLAPAGEGDIRLGLPDAIDDEDLERIYIAVEAAFPDLLDPRISVATAPLAQVLALAAADIR